MIRSLRASARCLFVWALFLLTCASTGANAQPTAPTVLGTQWLTAQVQPDGSLTGESQSLATSMQARDESARALKTLGVEPSSLLTIIGLEPDDSTEYLARRILSFEAGGRDNLQNISSLLDRQNADGGFGGAASHESNSLDTSFAVLALSTNKSSDSAMARALNYLKSVMQTGGAFGLTRSGQPSVYVSAMASSAFQRSADPSMFLAAEKVNSWLLSVQNADGSWGALADTCLVQLALIGANSDRAVLKTISNAIVAKQSSDGSWDGDPYATALALRALTGLSNSTFGSGTVVGRVIEIGTGNAVPGATVVLAMPSGASVLSDANGAFTFNGVSPGSYSMTVSSPGYSNGQLLLSVRAETTTEVGNVGIAVANNLAVLRGVATDAITHAPMSGVIVSVGGTSVTTKADGSYLLAELVPGQIQITASKTGYLSSEAIATIAAGTSVQFNPAMRAQSTSSAITGRVVDKATALPLSGVSVSLAETGALTTTDQNGRFTLSNVPAGAVSVNLTSTEYGTRQVSAVLPAGVTVDFMTIALEKNTQPPTTGTIQGVVREKATGLPLSGAAITVSGSGVYTASAAANGSFLLTNVLSGLVSLKVTKSGYVDANSTATITAGSTVVFNPQLDSITTIGLFGQVVDGLSHEGVVNASLTLDEGTAAVSTAATDGAGRFRFPTLGAGAHRLKVSAAGYAGRELSFVSNGAEAVELPAISISAASGPMAVLGKVTDYKTGLGIAGAVVEIVGSTLGATTSTDGSYRIEGATTGSHTIRYSATGYIGESVLVALPAEGNVTLDRALLPGKENTFSLQASTNVAHYPAYSPVSISVRIQNSGETATGNVHGIVTDTDGTFIEAVVLTRSGGDPLEPVTFAAGETELTTTWDTRAYPPGEYSITLRLVQGTGSGGNAGYVELARSNANITIDPTAAIGTARMTPLPLSSNIGAVEQVSFKVDVVNKSNVQTGSNLVYKLTSPSGVVVTEGTLELEIVPAESTKTLVTAPVQHTFTEAGEYKTTLAAAGGTIPAALAGQTLSVAPGTRVNLIHSVAPLTVTPDGDKRIQIEIRLQGVEQK